MGYGFVILFYLIILAVISGVIAVISGIIAYFISKPPKRKRKIFLAVFIPFQALFTLYFLATIGEMIISEVKGVDTGIGDCWYVPLNDSCRLMMIDSFEDAYIECDEETLLYDVTHLTQKDQMIFGCKNNGRSYFALSLERQILKTYASESELTTKQRLGNLDLVPVEDFYLQRKNEVAGTMNIVMGIASLLLTFCIVFIFCRLVLYGWRLGFIQKRDYF